jgi:predicted secreted protein
MPSPTFKRLGLFVVLGCLGGMSPVLGQTEPTQASTALPIQSSEPSEFIDTAKLMIYMESPEVMQMRGNFGTLDAQQEFETRIRSYSSWSRQRRIAALPSVIRAIGVQAQWRPRDRQFLSGVKSPAGVAIRELGLVAAPSLLDLHDDYWQAKKLTGHPFSLAEQKDYRKLFERIRESHLNGRSSLLALYSDRLGLNAALAEYAIAHELLAKRYTLWLKRLDPKFKDPLAPATPVVPEKSPTPVIREMAKDTVHYPSDRPELTPEQKLQDTEEQIARLARILELEATISDPTLSGPPLKQGSEAERKVLDALNELGEMKESRSIPLIADKISYATSFEGEEIPEAMEYSSLLAAKPSGPYSQSIIWAARSALREMGHPALPSIIKAAAQPNRSARFRTEAEQFAQEIAGGVEPLQGAILWERKAVLEKAGRLRTYIVE